MYKLCDNHQFSRLYSDVQETMDKWSIVNNTNAGIAHENLALFHSFPALQLNSLKKLENVKLSFQSIYEK